MLFSKSVYLFCFDLKMYMALHLNYDLGFSSSFMCSNIYFCHFSLRYLVEQTLMVMIF